MNILASAAYRVLFSLRIAAVLGTALGLIRGSVAVFLVFPTMLGASLWDAAGRHLWAAAFALAMLCVLWSMRKDAFVRPLRAWALSLPAVFLFQATFSA